MGAFEHNRLQVMDDSGPGGTRRAILNVEDVFKGLSEDFKAFASGRLVEGITIVGAGATTTIEHKLGRKLRGWILVRKDLFAATPGEVQEPDERFLYLRTAGSAADQVVSLWVF